MWLTPDNSRPRHRTLVRRAASAAKHLPIQVIEDSDAPPRVEGDERYYVFRKSGGHCKYPGAAMKAGYKVDYIKTTRRVIVGRHWLIQHVPGLIEKQVFEPNPA